MKRFFVLLLSVLMFVSLCACGNDADDSQGSHENQAVEAEHMWYFGGKSITSDRDPEDIFKDIKDTLDVNAVYGSVDYTEKMFYGSYTLNDQENDIDKLKDKISFKSYQFSNGTYNLLPVPVAVHFGKDYVSSSLAGYDYSDFKTCTDVEVASLILATETGTASLICKYSAEGNKVTFSELEQTSEKGQPLTYEAANNVFEYEFAFRGPYLTLSNGTDSVELVSYCFAENGTKEFELAGYSLPDSPLVDQLDHFHSSTGFLNYAIERSGEYYNISAFKMNDNGSISVYLSKKDESGNIVEFVKQYAYIAQSSGGFLNWVSLVLLDGEKAYYYTDDITRREARQLAGEGFDTSGLSDDKLKEIADKKSDLFDDLYNEFQSKGINVTINRATGEIAMDATVLFGGDSAVVTDEGKKLIDGFLSVYTSVIYNEKYDGFITKTFIEGHTAPTSDSTYESGVPLSTERAENVKAYCIASGADAKLTASLEAIGCSNSKPIYNNNGEIDMAACRRVSFSFAVNVN